MKCTAISSILLISLFGCTLDASGLKVVPGIGVPDSGAQKLSSTDTQVNQYSVDFSQSQDATNLQAMIPDLGSVVAPDLLTQPMNLDVGQLDSNRPQDVQATNLDVNQQDVLVLDLSRQDTFIQPQDTQTHPIDLAVVDSQAYLQPDTKLITPDVLPLDTTLIKLDTSPSLDTLSPQDNMSPQDTKAFSLDVQILVDTSPTPGQSPIGPQCFDDWWLGPAMNYTFFQPAPYQPNALCGIFLTGKTQPNFGAFKLYMSNDPTNVTENCGNCTEVLPKPMNPAKELCVFSTSPDCDSSIYYYWVINTLNGNWALAVTYDSRGDVGSGEYCNQVMSKLAWYAKFDCVRD
jgi:hypothetical protein